MEFRKDGPGIIWEGSGIDEVGRRADTKEIVIEIDPTYFRPTEVDLLIGDPSKARNLLGWSPKTNLEEMIEIMIESDLKKTREAFIKNK